MRKGLLAILCGVVASLTIVAAAFAEEYIVNIVVDGKPVALSVVVDGDTLAVDSVSPGVVLGSITAVAIVAEQPQPATSMAAANRNANLRGGPGTGHPIVGSVRTGQALTVIGRNPAGDWLQVADGQWIAASLVTLTNSAAPLPGTPAPALNTAAAPTATPASVSPTATPTAAPTTGPACDPSYPGICIPPNSPDLNCPDIQDRRFQVLPPDPHGFDRDKDGIGCE